MENKIKHGQFFTKVSPFNSDAFVAWSYLLPNKRIIEPFAGDCDLAKHLPEYDFTFYDIEPKHDNIIKNDSIKNFPKGYNVCITNPPYLGKSSAKRLGIEYNETLPDLYLASLEAILKNVDFLAAIIPASFLANKYFKDRLSHVDIITYKLFNDTDIPVIVAYFTKEHNKNGYNLYKNGKFVKVIDNIILKKCNNLKPKFNDDSGKLGLYAIDGTTGNRIRFCHASEIKRTAKTSDRAITKINVNIDINDNIINKLNKALEQYRIETLDTTLTAFRGLQKNGEHRKRISYDIAKQIIGAI